MKHLILALMLIGVPVSFVASAQSLKPSAATVRMEQWGEFYIRIQPQIDAQPYILTLSLSCDRNPKLLKRLLTRKVCEYRGYTEDKENKTLTLHYSVFNDIDDGRLVAHCDQTKAYIVDIKLECESRKP